MNFLGISHKTDGKSFSAKNRYLGSVEVRPSGSEAYSIYVEGRPASMNVPAVFVHYLAKRFDLPRLLASDAVAGDVYGALKRAYYEALSRDAIYLARGDWAPYMVRPEQEKILNYVLEYEKVTLREAAVAAGLTERNAKVALSDLADKRLLSIQGAGRGAYHVLRGMEIFGRRDYDLVLPESQVSVMLATRRATRAKFSAMGARALASKCSYPAELDERFARIAELSKARGASLDPEARKRRYEKLVVDFSFSSSKYEGNTYSLLETERLLFHNLTAAFKKPEEAAMLLNHKRALEFAMANRAKFRRVTPELVVKLHGIVSDGLGIEPGIRTKPVGVKGTSYEPTNDRKELERFLAGTCEKINAAKSPVEKAVIANTHVAFAQAFMDGNKRTARMLGNAGLVAAGFPPIAFKVVRSDEYHGSILTFYETADPRFFMLNFIKELQNSVNSYLGMG